MTSVLTAFSYIVLGVSCYIFIAYAMHIDRDKLFRFLLVLALFMMTLFFSPVYKELMTPYILIFWPFQFGVMLYVCDAFAEGGVKRILSCIVPMAAAGVMGCLMQSDPINLKSLTLIVAPWCAGVGMGIVRRMVHGKIA